MYIVNGIAYAGEQSPALRVVGVRPLENFCLWVRFNNDEARIFDFKPLLETPAFSRLADSDTFKNVYIDYGVPTWCDGDIDIAPEMLYKKGECVEGVRHA